MTIQGLGLVFDQFKNLTLSDGGNLKSIFSAFTVYLAIFMATKIVNCVPIFLDGLILTI